MFGMGFAEIVIITIIAILFLGPDKLPQAMVEIAKFFRSVKKTVGSAKESLEHELNVASIKEEALNYKKELASASDEFNKIAQLGDLNEEINEVKDDFKNAAAFDNEEKKIPLSPPKPEVVTFAKKDKPSSEKSV